MPRRAAAALGGYTSQLRFWHCSKTVLDVRKSLFISPATAGSVVKSRTSKIKIQNSKILILAQPTQLAELAEVAQLAEVAVARPAFVV